MFTRRADDAVRPSLREAIRLSIVVLLLVASMAAILGVSFTQGVTLAAGDLAPTDLKAPRALTFTNPILTDEARAQARATVGPQYDFTSERAIAIADEQLAAFGRKVAALDSAFAPQTTPEDRAAILAEAVPGLSGAGRTTLEGLDPQRWPAVRTEAARVLDLTERTEVRDTEVAVARNRLDEEMAGGLTDAERSLAAELIAPLLLPNSSYSESLTLLKQDAVAAGVAPVVERFVQGEVVVRAGTRISDLDMVRLDALGLGVQRFDPATPIGWLLVSGLVVAAILGWIWRFRRTFWHRNNVLLLLGLTLVFATFALKLTAGRAAMSFVLPVAAVGILITVLLDAETAIVLTLAVGLIGGAVNGSLELAAYEILGGFAGILLVGRGDRLALFLRAGLGVFVAQAAVVAAFSFLGERDITGIVQLIGAAGLAAGGAAVAAVGSFAVLGNLFGILTVFQLLELANPSQPLLRRLLIETPGTYHHALMVGNLAERAAEVIGADPLLARVAAYYHDIGKLADPLAFIENQAGGENVHDTMDPEQSAQVLRAHVADGIELAYRNRLPKALIAFIPQHHGTAVMGYFLAKARERAAAPFGGPATEEGRRAAAAVDPARFRHAGPRPQSREAALIMLADSVEASVRSLESRDEPAIRAMVNRIITERMEDGQFDECDLTLRDVDRVEDAFVAQLLGMYHQRIAYPQNKVVEIESRRARAAGDDADR
jgi:putative nucleotidyltransferase with HDIG domain